MGKCGWNGLMFACFYGNFEIVKFLIHSGCNFNCRDRNGWNVFMIACFRKNLKLAKFLMNEGCEIFCKDFNSGQNSLHYAISMQEFEIATFLIEHGLKSSNFFSKNKIFLQIIEDRKIEIYELQNLITKILNKKLNIPSFLLDLIFNFTYGLKFLESKKSSFCLTKKKVFFFESTKIEIISTICPLFLLKK